MATADLLHQRSGRLSVWWALVGNPWWWLVVTTWSLFSIGTTLRDNFLDDGLRRQLQVLDYLPRWPWWHWALGFLGLTVAFLGEGAYRRIARLEDALYDRSLPGLNASDIAPWREKGRTLTNEWRHLGQHGAASQYQTAQADAEAWRLDMVARLTRKYGGWVATLFNTTREADSEGLPVLSPLAEHDARAERLAQIMYDVGTGKIQPVSDERF
jgi:hypothetical protein